MLWVDATGSALHHRDVNLLVSGDYPLDGLSSGMEPRVGSGPSPSVEIVMSDTEPWAAAAIADLWRHVSPDRRVEMTGEMFATARELALSGLRAAGCPDDPVELRVRLFLRFYGNDFDDATRDWYVARLREYHSG